VGKMSNRKLNSKTDRELQKVILQEKARGTSDLEIGQKYGVTFKYIEKLITRSQGLNISTLKFSKNKDTLSKRFQRRTNYSLEF